MVNEKTPDTRSRLLSLLHNAESPLSGEDLSRRLGVSRVAVHKHMDRLRQAGYAVESSRSGYRMTGEPVDPLEEWSFPGLTDVHYRPESDSTMVDALAVARRDPDAEGYFLAARQTAGRGTRGRPWDSGDGGLYTTALYRPGGSAGRAARWTLLGAAALTTVLREDHGLNAVTRWPNDIYVGDRKVGGVLTDYRAEADRLSWLALGTGVNVNNQPDDPRAASLKQLVGSPLSRHELFLALRSRLEALRPDPDWAAWIWWELCLHRDGRLWQARLSDGRLVTGRPTGIDEAGCFLLKTPDEEVRLRPGDTDKLERIS